jgi:hypothetical protein
VGALADLFVPGRGTSKGKSVVEGQTLFRSSAKAFDSKLMGDDGIFLSPNKGFVQRWQTSQGYKHFEEFVLTPEAKILRRKDIPKKFIRNEGGLNFTSLDDQADIIKYAKNNGFDGFEDFSVRGGKKLEHEFAVWNKDVISVGKNTKNIPGVFEGTMTKVGTVELMTKELGDKLHKDLGNLSTQQSEMMAIAMATAKAAEFNVGKGTAKGIAAAKDVISLVPDKAVRKQITTTADYIREFAKKQGLKEENLYHVYYPTSDATRLKSAFRGAGKVGVGRKDYLKRYQNLVPLENIEKSPIDALFGVQSKLISDKVYGEHLTSVVKHYGKPLKEFADSGVAEAAGFRMLRDKGGTLGKEVGWVTKEDHKFLQTMMNPGEEYKALDTFAKATGFDAVTNLFKRSVTGLFAPFHVRNYVSGMIQGYETVGNRIFSPTAISQSHNIASAVAMNRKLHGKLFAGGTEYSLEQIKELLVTRFGLVQGMATEGFSKKLVARPKLLSGKSIKKSLVNPLGQESIVFRSTRGVTSYTELQNKANIMVASLLNGDDIQKALKLAERGAFDYRAMTAFESKVLRRIIPFYSFTRKNIELQARTAVNNPERIANVFKFVRELGDSIGGTMTAEEKESLPDYMKQAFNIKTGEDEFGQLEVTSQLGTPIEQFTQLFSGNPVLNSISQMNPILKVPLELGFGKDSFREKDIKLTYNAKEYSAAPQFIKNFLKIQEQQKPIYKDGKLTKQTKTQYAADPERLLFMRSLFTSRGVTYLDQIFDGDLSKTSKWLKSLTGVKPTIVDEETTRFFREDEQKTKLEDLLQRRDRLSQFQNSYVSKRDIRNFRRRN